MNVARVQASIDELVETYRTAFTRHCTCGAPECATPTPADRHDYRVMSCTLLSVLDIVTDLVAEGDVETAMELARTTVRYAHPAIEMRLDADPTWSETLIEWRDRLVSAHGDLEDRIRAEMVETGEDIGAHLVAEEAAASAEDQP